jgi:hypothetical protein
MKKLSDFRSDLNEAGEIQNRKVDVLVRAGLGDKGQLSHIKHALAKEDDKLTPSERHELLGILRRLLTTIDGDQNTYRRIAKMAHGLGEEIELEEAGYNKPIDPPPTILLRRKAIRVYPDGRRVALYYADKLDRYISIPYSAEDGKAEKNIPVVEQVLNEGDQVLRAIEEIATSGEPKNVTFDDKSSMMVTLEMAQSILEVLGKVNEQNHKKLTNMLGKDKNNFIRAANFAHGAKASAAQSELDNKAKKK